MIAFTESNRHLIPAKRDRHLQNDRASSEKAIASSSLIPTKRDRSSSSQKMIAISKKLTLPKWSQF